MKTLFTTLALAIALTTADVQAAQSDYPARPVRLLVPFPPGGSNDIMARYFGQYLTERLGQSVIIDNRGGAEGIIATDIVAHDSPDGYTLLFVSGSRLGIGVERE